MNRTFRVSFKDSRDGLHNEKILEASTESEVFAFMADEGHSDVEVEDISEEYDV